MRYNGYRAAKSWYTSYKTPGIARDGGKLYICGNAVCDIASTARLHLRDDLVLGANLRKGSRAETYLKIKERGEMHVNGRFQVFFGGSLEVFPEGKLTLGSGYINTGAAVACAHSITIGDGTYIARNVYITDSDHHRIYAEDGELLNPPKPVVIGSHVLIGFGAVVLKGVHVGDGAIIAAGSVVTKDIGTNCMVAGIPARVIKENVSWK